MNESNNTQYYEEVWENATFKPSFALLDDETMKKAKYGYDFGCVTGEKLAKQKVDSFVLTQKMATEKNIRRNRFLLGGGVALTVASGVVTILDPSLLGLSSTLTTLGFTTVMALHKKEQETNLEELELLSDKISNDNSPTFKIKKNRFI